MSQRSALLARQRAYGLHFDALVVHCPAPMRSTSTPFHLEWEAACRMFFADRSLRGAFRDVDDLTVVTINTRTAPELLERCFAHLGLRLVVLGAGVPEWTWSCKITLVRDWLQAGGCETPLLLYLDGDDVLLIGDPADVVRRWRVLGSEMLFCNTRGDWPPDAAAAAFEDAVNADFDPLHRHLNAGGWIGRTPYIAKCLDEIVDGMQLGEPWCHAAHGFDDQLAWRWLHRREHPRMRVDAGCRVFLRFDEDR